MTRIRCCIPFCNRTRRHDESVGEWICAEHWREVPKAKRAAWNRVRKKLRKACAINPGVKQFWSLPSGSPERLSAVRLWRVHDRIWSAVKRAAMEKAGGI